MTGLRHKVLSGAFWALLERLSTQFVSFGMTLVLARLLTPGDYGTVALLTIFTAIAGTLADSGFGQALVQKKNATEEDFNSVFYFSIGISTCLYGILFGLAPWVAEFYETPELVPILRVISITVVCNAINSVQNAELNRRFLFNRSFRISLISSITSGVTGIALAVLGFGPWALVWSQVASGVAGVVSRWFLIAWRPKMLFSWKALRSLYSFGWKLTVSSLIDTVYSNFYGLLIGKIYSKADLAFVNRGYSLPQMAMMTINSTIGRVSFPALAQMQDDKVKVVDAMRKIIGVSTYIVLPLLTGVAVCASQIVMILFGEKWMAAVPFVCIACFEFALWPFHTINLQTITALGRSDLYLKMEIAKKLLIALLVLVSFRSGVWTMMAVLAFVGGPIGSFVNSLPASRVLGYGLFRQFKDIVPTLLCCLMMALAIGFVPKGVQALLPTLEAFPSALVSLGLQVILGGMVYVGMSWMLRLVPFQELLGILKSRRKVA